MMPISAMREWRNRRPEATGNFEPSTNQGHGSGAWALVAAQVAHLHLDGCPITDAGLAQLRPLKLESLSLGGCPISDAELAQLRPLELAHLYLDGCPVTDAGLAHLRPLKLEGLGLRGCPVTDAGLQQLDNMPTLLFLNVTRTKVTKAGLDKFQESTSPLRHPDMGGTPTCEARSAGQRSLQPLKDRFLPCKDHHDGIRSAIRRPSAAARPLGPGGLGFCPRGRVALPRSRFPRAGAGIDLHRGDRNPLLPPAPPGALGRRFRA